MNEKKMETLNVEPCFVCEEPIEDSNEEEEGDKALLCEGLHKRWAHARCVGV